MLKVYGDLRSGNCYKVKLLLTQLGLPHEWLHTDIMQGETRTAAFLARNPNGKIPLLEFDDGECLAESNAILCYLAEGSPLLPAAGLGRARALQWMFFEQYSHEPYIAVARFIVRYLGRPADQELRLAEKMAPGYKALQVMEQHLASRQFFVDERYSVADIALYAYTHVANEGGFDLAGFPAVRAWLERLRSEPRYINMRGEGVSAG
jgi:glutathione S-transferase